MIRHCPRIRPDSGRYRSLNPYIVVAGIEDLIDFLRDVFGAVERGEREISADGTIGLAEVETSDSVVMLSEATPAYPAQGNPDSVVRVGLRRGHSYIAESRISACSLSGGVP